MCHSTILLYGMVRKVLPNISLNLDYDSFSIHFTRKIQGEKPAGCQRNSLLDAVVKIMRFN